MTRILGLDVGNKTIGVALSDPLGFTAQGITTINRSHDLKQDFIKLKEICDNYKVELIVIGLPKHMNGSIGTQAKLVKNFVIELQNNINLPIEYIDERLTTVLAQKSLIEGNIKKSKRKQIIDKQAAVFILQTYLDKQYNKYNK